MPRGVFSTTADLAEKLAKQYGISHTAVKRAGKQAEAMEQLARVAPEAARAVTTGEKRHVSPPGGRRPASPRRRSA